MESYVEQILRARVYDVAKETPLDLAPKLSDRYGERVLLKREDLQPVFSFKLRGAYNKIVSLPPEQARRGLICASAGNHAQGVALAAAKLGYPATIVMPRTTTVSLAIRTASSSPSYDMIANTGPKISARAIVISFVTLAKTVGLV